MVGELLGRGVMNASDHHAAINLKVGVNSSMIKI